MSGLGAIALDVAWVLIWGALIYASLRGLRWFVDLLPLSRSRRELVARASPVIATLVALVFALFAAGSVFGGHPQALPFALVLVVAAFVAAGWSAIRDFVSGVVLKAEGVCDVGDHVRIGKLEGRIETMGLRAMTLETVDSDVAVVPYGTLARESIVRTHAVESGQAHAFRAPLPKSLSLAEARTRIRAAALGNHWASFVREPEIVGKDAGEIEVTVYALDPDRAPEVESAVRRALSG